MNLGMDFLHLGVDPGGELREQFPSTRVVRNLCTIMAGAEPIEIPMEIQEKAQSFLSGCQLSCNDSSNIKYYGFSLPDGDHLLGLWIDGKAMDAYDGVASTVTITDFATDTVIGIDVLYGFKQELITSVVDGNLVIENLLVTDYPILLQLTH